jgi:hypothetical protein
VYLYIYTLSLTLGSEGSGRERVVEVLHNDRGLADRLPLSVLTTARFVRDDVYGTVFYYSLIQKKFWSVGGLFFKKYPIC